MKYSDLAQVYQQLESTSKRLEKTHIIAELLKKTSTDDIDKITLLLQGKVFPSYDESKLGVASQLVIKAIHTATGIKTDKIQDEWRKTGDLGKVAENLVAKKKQATLLSKELTISKVFENLKKLPAIEGAGSVDRKISLIAELLTSAKPLEARYIVRNVLEELRVGVGSGSLRDAVTWAYFGDKLKIKYDDETNDIKFPDRELYNKYTNAVQHAFDVTNDLSIVAKTAKDKGLKGLEKVEMEVGRPIKVMLALKVKNIKEGFERVGKPGQVEYKYDGFRMQIHKKGNEIRIYTRRLENVTKQFPEIVDYVKKQAKGESFILEGEAVGFDPKTKKYLPFQNVSQRIKRKYDIKKMSGQFPVELNLFDIIYYNGKSLIKKPFKERRALLEKIIKPTDKRIVLAKKLVTSHTKQVEKFYNEALNNSQEGIMMKTLDALYKPGARVGYMVKIKPVMESLDLIIVAAEWGEGKRSGWLTSYTLACIDEDGKLLTIGKSSTGLKEKPSEGLSFQEMTEILKPLIINQKGKLVKVKPQVVIEVQYEEIQKSPTYESGYALRFPRVIRLRSDRGVDDITPLDIIEGYYKAQKK
ncbi:hypothetical protein A3K72_00285 [Candidatus Woesearchaeota archaeon RBG_13_36_6]|nr:MAG: hypothetical protein A3K72_00285 [Candidatus Woesearchaeota archaeon RBG_13_36_6]